jgi:glycerol-3-phosphate acyltransferase PlsY
LFDLKALKLSELSFVVLTLQEKHFIIEVVPYTLISIAMACLIFYAHRENIVRLRNGTEPSFGSKKK